jgi:hypothetical protein
MTTLARAGAALALALASGGALAGGPLGVCFNQPIKYPGAGTVTLNYDLGTLGSRSKAAADTLVTNSVSLWTNVPTATVSLARGADLSVDVNATNYLPFLNNSSFSDGINPVIYDTDGLIVDALFGLNAKNSVLGFAGSAWSNNGSICQYVEGRAVISGFLAISDTTMGVVFAHEIGHLIGMDHTQLDSAQGLSSGNYPLMYPIAFRNVLSLHDDDAAAVSALYPDATVAANYGTLTGTFTTAGGTRIQGANIYAQGAAGVFSNVSDYLSQNTGAFRLLLKPGTYALRAQAIDTDFTGGSSVGPFSEDTNQPSFQPPLYVGGVAMPIIALGGNATPTQITITAGCLSNALFRIDGTGSVTGNCAAPSPVQRTFVASYGSDLNTSTSCNLATPCRGFAAALSVTVPGGEIVALNAAGYGTVTIDKSVTITANPGYYAGISASTGDAVTIATAGVHVILRGLNINGIGATNGVSMTAGSSLTVENSVISNFSASGIFVNNAAAVRVSGSTIRGNMNGVLAQAGSTVDISRSSFKGNSAVGVRVRGDVPAVVTGGTVSESTATGNGVGFQSVVTTGIARLVIRRSTASYNGTAGMQATGGAAATLVAARSVVTGNGTGLSNSGATLESQGNNMVRQNTTNTSGTITAIPGL